MRAVFSARSMLRDIQKRFSAVRLSMAQRSSTQVSLVPPPWLELTTSEPSRKRDPRQTAGDHAGLLAGEHEGPEIDVARRDLAVDQGRRGGKRQRRLGDIVVGVGHHAALIGLALLGGRGGPDQHAVAAGALHFLDHQIVQIVEDVLPLLRDRAACRCARC